MGRALAKDPSDASQDDLSYHADGHATSEILEGSAGEANGEAFDHVPSSKRTIGLWSAIFLIFNRIIGTGIFATPSSILETSGSVGLSLFMWLIGALIATSGLLVYVEWGTGLPRSGGELTYLSYTYPMTIVACYAAYAALMPWPAGNSVVFGEYILLAAGKDVTQWNQRAIGIGCVTFAFIMHSCFLKWGIRLQNALGVFKLVILALIVFSGFAALAGRVKVDPKPDNFARANVWDGTRSDANAFVSGLYNVIWSFIGYSNVNYSLSEVKNPVRTLKIAGPIAMASITVVYMLVNVAYFAAVSKTDILNSGRTVAALYFRNMFGAKAEKALSVFVALSALGNVLSVLFSLGRINQELGRRGIIPFPRFFASSKPFNSPSAGLALQWLMCIIVIVAPPPGDAFNFVLNLVSYPFAIVNAFISFSLLYLYTPWSRKKYDWSPPFRATWPVVLFFFLSNVFLAIAPLVPPAPGLSPYESLPYWLHVVVAIGVFAVGGAIWIFYAVVLPRSRGYRLESVEEVGEDGVQRDVFRRKYE
ncbi:high affinity methionine permease [Stereum hirsutum FP-91666 SS1]|uniref:high affinity methionine permease n=1 Tax=Stereum hirsutum (strain FP-91666) TaxID=721885 RepID=UPI000440B071|nr:high affinity methionine permease [Stereum hirsutum FP-91666 SS1]EIM87629.1 high affinity methionine permease [Stereum hirsutum FP-91666 SS1]